MALRIEFKIDPWVIAMESVTPERPLVVFALIFKEVGRLFNGPAYPTRDRSKIDYTNKLSDASLECKVAYVLHSDTIVIELHDSYSEQKDICGGIALKGFPSQEDFVTFLAAVQQAGCLLKERAAAMNERPEREEKT